MKYVVLIYSNPDPWGHPTSAYTEGGRALPETERAERDRRFDALLQEISASGEFVTAEALAAPETSRLFTEAEAGRPIATDGPYAEAKEHLAGFFLLDCATRERAEELAIQFTCPGDTIELRPAMSPGSDAG